MAEKTHLQRQPAQGLMAYPANGLRKALFKMPILLWRLGLGPIIGRVLILITQTGRKSGLPRRTMVEYHKLDGVKYAPCAFGPQSDWYQNILADSHLTIQTAYGVESVTATRVTSDQELLAVYNLFRRRDPPLLRLYLVSLGIQDNPADVLANKERIYWLRFDPIDEPTPPPLEADLVWVLPVIFAGFMALWWLSRHLKGPS